MLYRVPMSHHVNTRVSSSLWNARTHRAEISGQSVSHIVQTALADALDIEHHSLFQVSTSGAIVQGLQTDEHFLEIHDVCDVHLAIPETADLVSADLSGDHQAALNIAEHQRVN